MQMIKVRDMGHSQVNLDVRKSDSIDPKTNKENGATQKQMQAFQRDILKGRQLKDVHPANRSEVNWLLGSVFIVEKRVSPADMHDKAYSVLSGSHRLSWLESNVAMLRGMAQIERKTAETSLGDASIEHDKLANDLDKKAEAWLDFEISCEIVTCADDDERRAVVARGNADAPASDTQVKQAAESKFPAFYDVMPCPEYLYMYSPVKKDAIVAVEGSREGWQSPEYWALTGIGGNNHVTFSALSRLGRHFGVPKSFFTPQRLKIKPEVTPSLLVKKTKLGEGSDRVKHLDLGLELRYKKARADAFGDNDAMENAFQDFKAEFLALMDANGTGENALGNEPMRTASEKAEDKKVQDAAIAEAKLAGEAAKVEKRGTYAFEKQACARVLELPGATPIPAVIGNALDLLNIVPESKYSQEAITALAAWKLTPQNESAIVAAIAALAKMLESTLPAQNVTPIVSEAHEQAASAKRNTKKGAK